MGYYFQVDFMQKAQLQLERGKFLIAVGKERGSKSGQ